MFRISEIKSKLLDGSLKGKVIRASAYTLVGLSGRQFLRLCSNLILTRLLFPEAFGIMALVSVFMMGLGMFSDIGVGPSIIQSKQGDEPKYLNTAWSIQVLRGVCIWVMTCLIAVPVASFYDQPILSDILPVAGLSAVISGFNSTKIFSNNRHLVFGRLTALGLIAQVINITAVIVLAWIFRSVWALVIGNLIGVISKTFLSHFFLPGKTNRFQWDSNSARSLFKFGKWIFVSTLFTFLGRQGDKLIFGALFTMGWLGVYSIAMMLMMSAVGVLRSFTGRVAYAAFSKLNYLPATEFRDRIAEPRRKIIFGWAIFSALFIVFADPFVRALWDPRFEDAGWMASILGLALWPIGLKSLSSQALTSRGIPKYDAYGQIAAAVSVITIVPTAFHLGGEIAALFAVTVGYWLAYAIAFTASVKHQVIYAIHDFQGHFVFFVLLIIGCLSRTFFDQPVFPWQ